MNRLASVVTAAVLAGMSAAAYAALSGDKIAAPFAPLVTDRQAATLVAGTKTVVAYYLQEPGRCNVAVVVSETYPDQLPYHLSSVRLRTNVAEGASADVAASDGAALSLTCGRGAKTLSISSSELAQPVIVRATN